MPIQGGQALCTQQQEAYETLFLSFTDSWIDPFDSFESIHAETRQTRLYVSTPVRRRRRVQVGEGDSLQERVARPSRCVGGNLRVDVAERRPRRARRRGILVRCPYRHHVLEFLSLSLRNEETNEETRHCVFPLRVVGGLTSPGDASSRPRVRGQDLTSGPDVRSSGPEQNPRVRPLYTCMREYETKRKRDLRIQPCGLSEHNDRASIGVNRT